MRGFLIGLILVCWPGWGAWAAEKKSEEVMVWFTSHVCKDKLEPDTPGSTPELAIVIEDFSKLHEDAVNAKKQARQTIEI